jgi:hypothetical protein
MGKNLIEYGLMSRPDSIQHDRIVLIPNHFNNRNQPFDGSSGFLRPLQRLNGRKEPKIQRIGIGRVWWLFSQPKSPILIFISIDKLNPIRFIFSKMNRCIVVLDSQRLITCMLSRKFFLYRWEYLLQHVPEVSIVIDIDGCRYDGSS